MRRWMYAGAALTALSVCAGTARAEQAVLSEKDIKRVVGHHADEIKRCYTKHALDQRGASGKVVLGMVVARDGSVREKTIEVDAPGVRGHKFAKCVRARVSQWEFPSAKSATEVRYPFLFHHTRRRR